MKTLLAFLAVSAVLLLGGRSGADDQPGTLLSELELDSGNRLVTMVWSCSSVNPVITAVKLVVSEYYEQADAFMQEQGRAGVCKFHDLSLPEMGIYNEELLKVDLSDVSYYSIADYWVPCKFEDNFTSDPPMCLRYSSTLRFKEDTSEGA